MPSVNPFIDTGVNAQSWDGAPVVQQSALPGAIGAPTSPGQQGVGVVGSQIVRNVSAVLTGMGTQNTTNAAGTSENVAMHVAILVAVALVAVYVFRQSGFRFVAAGSVG